MASSREPATIVVAIDYGTTRTRVAFAVANNSNQTRHERIYMVDWKDQGDASDQVPSEIAYLDKGSHHLCGNNIDMEISRLTYLKLKFNKEKLPEYVSEDDLQEQLDNAHKTYEEAITDFLKDIYMKTKSCLKTRLGKELVNGAIYHYYFTVPAKWSETAKDATLRAAKRAGFGPQVKIIYEPEAAAIYAIKSMTDQSVIRQGENYVICDAGGGTIDLVTYEVKDLARLEINESLTGTGDLGGGAFIDTDILQWIKDRVGAPLFEEQLGKTGLWRTFLDTFAKYKAKVSASSNKETFDRIPIHLSDNDAVGIKGQKIIISSNKIKEIFDRQVSKVETLVSDQLEKAAKKGMKITGVILVGGFGSSHYVQETLEERFGRYLDIMVCYEPSVAVAKGAVLTGLERGLVSSRKARKHYGVICMLPFDASKHSEDVKVKSATGHDLADKQIRWLVNKDGDLEAHKPVKYNFYDHWAMRSELPTDYKIEFVVSDEEDPPEEFQASPRTRHLCYLPVDISTGLVKQALKDMDIDSIAAIEAGRAEKDQTKKGKGSKKAGKKRKRGNNMPEFRSLKFDLELLLTGPQIEFDMTINDRFVGHIAVDYSEQDGQAVLKDGERNGTQGRAEQQDSGNVAQDTLEPVMVSPFPGSKDNIGLETLEQSSVSPRKLP